jgi:hypothetical protein
MRHGHRLRKAAAPAAVLAACALAGLASLAAPTAAGAAAAPAGGPSGIGLNTGGPQVLGSATYYGRALSSPDWTTTPGGLVYKSCVSQIPKGGTLDAADNTILLASGATRPIPDCPYPRLVQPAATAAAGASAPSVVGPFDPDWLVAEQGTSESGPLNELRVGMAVPSRPHDPVSSRADYLSAGFFAVTGSTEWILEPTIGYGPGNIFFIASYFFKGSAVVRGPVAEDVAAGNTIEAGITAHSACTTSCTWTITTQDRSTGAESNLVVTTTGTEFADVIAALSSDETNCDQLFGGGDGAFRGLGALTNSRKQATLRFGQLASKNRCGAVASVGNASALDLLWTDTN